ncbi:MAG TPA: hypothetical protein ENH55_04870 [Aurantimonas coralicida]|uniref:Uncharacterized protein n=2 Tax=root TaxID=1 RepID=A0A9C9NCT0_9HYPH|nr:hypothetical protein [Aurantimonas coralicida]HET99140.1 hypothetical protein [Aurantimonas coralicida]
MRKERQRGASASREAYLKQDTTGLFQTVAVAPRLSDQKSPEYDDRNPKEGTNNICEKPSKDWATGLEPKQTGAFVVGADPAKAKYTDHNIARASEEDVLKKMIHPPIFRMAWPFSKPRI